jgi:hypothetical protein
MGLKLNIIKTSAIAGCLAFSACATVDMTDMSGSQSETVTKAVDVNVVQRAASRLYSVFINRGFVEKTSRNKMRSAARMLLKGLENTPLSREVNYASTVESLDVIKSDIVFAQSYVDQTRQAAEIYLAMAPGETSLKKELSSLQQALAAANEAKNSFSEALEAKQADTTQVEFVTYVESVTALSEVTDAFGVRVRAMSMGAETPSIG